MTLRPLSSDDPNLRQAALRMRRTLWIWAALAAGMGILSAAPAGGGTLVPAAGWLAAAALMALLPQPALLALTAALWALSLLAWIPGVGAALGTDPLTVLLQPGTFESLGLAVVRLLLAATAWNQFLFYRMLYGTGRAAGLDANLPPIPEVVRNLSDRLAKAALALGAAALAVASVSWAVTLPLRPTGVQTGVVLASFALGLGLGAAFSPTQRRAAALLGVGLAGIAIVVALAAGTTLPT
jgi:hypothetical protein